MQILRMKKNKIFSLAVNHVAIVLVHFFSYSFSLVIYFVNVIFVLAYYFHIGFDSILFYGRLAFCLSVGGVVPGTAPRTFYLHFDCTKPSASTALESHRIREIDFSFRLITR